MKKLFFFLLIFVFSSLKVGLVAAPLEIVQKVKKNSIKKHLARIPVLITVYTPDEDYYSGKHQTATGMILRKGIAAVNFKKFAIGTKLQIQGWGKFICGDTGTAVISRKAARERGLHCLVIDVFAETHAAAQRMLANNPELTYCSIIE